MHIHILGICGTFMAGVAALARAMNHDVTGSDAGAYPPMSTQLAQLGIGIAVGYEPRHLNPTPDLIIVGNALSRGNPLVECMLRARIPYISGPQWLYEQVLAGRTTLAIAGTHGKTTTASILAWLLEDAGLAPGFLIGGVPQNFGVSARLGDTSPFVIEADEYDTAFFDKRSKFVHYRPHVAVLNNLEYDHADIFKSIEDIKTQLHHFIRTIADDGCLIVNREDRQLHETLELGVWTPIEEFSIDHNTTLWSATAVTEDCRRHTVEHHGKRVAEVQWTQMGRHNMSNALAAVAAAYHAGVTVEQACRSLATYQPVKRRLQCIYSDRGVHVYDDFAHHPTAIRQTLAALRAATGSDRIIAVFEPRSNSMRMGVYRDDLLTAFDDADMVWIYNSPPLAWDIGNMRNIEASQVYVVDSIDSIVEQLLVEIREGDHVIIMSNGDFSGIHQRLIGKLEPRLKSSTALHS